MEQPVKPNGGQYKVQPGRIEHYTPGKSSISDKEAKQVNNCTRRSFCIFEFQFPINPKEYPLCTLSPPKRLLNKPKKKIYIEILIDCWVMKNFIHFSRYYRNIFSNCYA